MRNIKGTSFLLLFAFITVACYITYGLARYETVTLIASWLILFGLYIWIIGKENEIGFWLIGAVIVRLSLLMTLPNLSDDFYRFIWDGRLWMVGEHPFTAVPSEFLSRHLPGIDDSLFNNLNSDNYTSYPPIAQAVFWLSVKIFPHSILGAVIVMRVLIIVAELGSIALMLKLLARFQLPKRTVLIYAMNPLVILELTGNLHFEAFVIFFLLLSIWLLGSEKILAASASFACAIGVKLLPAIFLPLMLRALGWKKGLVFCGAVGLFSLILFIPLYDEQVLRGFFLSLDLYFQKFEFNASLYYLIREYGFWKYGYNTIQSVGWKLALVSTLLILIYAWLKGEAQLELNPGKLFIGLLFSLCIYLFFSTIIHPWYITPLLAFSVFTNFRFVVLWTFMIFFTYTGYTQQGFSENLWLITLEYLLVFGYLGYEIVRYANFEKRNI